MRILALDSSGLVASVAIMEEDNMIGEYTIHNKLTHSQTLLPMLDEVVRMSEAEFESIDAIAIASGPGSFTGLRIGSATAKGLGQALDKPLVEVPTLEAMAYNLYGTTGIICPIMDARRNRVFTGIYRWEKSGLSVIEDQMALDIDELISKLDGYGERIIFLGDAVTVFKEKILEGMGNEVLFVPPHLLRQRAGAVAALGMEYFKAGKYVTATQHQPDYLQLSQAERERAKKS